MAISRRYLGHLNALKDTDFKDHFLPPRELAELLAEESHVVFGTKGSGKTALRRALTELQSSRFFATETIDLDNISFQRIHSDLSKLREATGDEVIALARNTWKNLLLLYCLECVRAKLPETFVFIDQLNSVLIREHFSGRSASARILNHIALLFEKIAALGVGDDVSSVTAERSEVIQKTLDSLQSSEIPKLVEHCAGIVKDAGRPALICIDGFDSISDHTAESRRAIFAGLMDAVVTLSENPALGGAFIFKAFLPRELTREAERVVWDSDKFFFNFLSLGWSEDELKAFIQKRLQRHSQSGRRNDVPFDEVWHEFMPKSVRNVVHSLDESSFGYVLRHTQYRPRHLLIQVQSILTEWDLRSKAFRVDASFIPKSVERCNRRLAQKTLDQLEYSLPRVTEFMRSWSGSSSTITFRDCMSKVRRLFDLGSSGVAHLEIFEHLVELGLLGFAAAAHIEPGAKFSRFAFSYVGENHSSMHRPSDEDIIAICPMFQEFCGCLPSRFGAIIPTGA